jgi:predicted metal-dependent hydrolase
MFVLRGISYVLQYGIEMFFKRRNTTVSSAQVSEVKRVTVLRKSVKHARILVHHDGNVHFVVPHRYADEKIRFLLRKHADWINKQRSRFSSLERISLSSDEILYRGETLRFHQRYDLQEAVEIHPTEQLILSGVNLLEKDILEAWYHDEAERIIPQRVQILAYRFGFNCHRVRVTSPKTIWGSCSARNVISINWRLIKAPPFVLDYLILHELVHTEVHDHSKRFWKRVAEVCPRYEEAVKWLKTYGRWI